MRKTNNPDVPMKDEVGYLGKHGNLNNKRGSTNDAAIQPIQNNYDFMNYPEAIPEEVFVYFGNQVGCMEDLKKATQREIHLNLHFMRHYHQIIEQREDKEVYLANGFTQRNQKCDEVEEKLRQELISDFNEFESINKEVESIMGNSTSNIAGLKDKTQAVLRSKLTPDKRRDNSPLDPLTHSKSLRTNDGKSPIDLYVKAGRLVGERRGSQSFFTTRIHQPAGILLEEIEEELNRTGK